VESCRETVDEKRPRGESFGALTKRRYKRRLADARLALDTVLVMRDVPSLKRFMTQTCILQVEDEANDVFLLQRAFRQARISNPVKVASDGQMAIDYLSGTGLFENRGAYPLPGLILLDLKLPRKSGREVLQWIRAQPGLRRIVVIVFTSGKYIGDVGLAYDLGANSFLVKPTDFSQYLAIARLLKDWWLSHNLFAAVLEPNWPFQFSRPDQPWHWGSVGNPS